MVTVDMSVKAMEKVMGMVVMEKAMDMVVMEKVIDMVVTDKVMDMVAMEKAMIMEEDMIIVRAMVMEGIGMEATKATTTKEIIIEDKDILVIVNRKL